MESHYAVGDEGRSDWTYIQAGFSPANCMEQFRLLRERYGKEILFHIEFMKNGEGSDRSRRDSAGLFHRRRAAQRVDCLLPRDRGIFANPHVNYLEDGGRFRADNIQLKAKQKYDPRGLLNPGKMISFHRGASGEMKTWIPDARNFAYLTWKQVDALPRESTLLILPTAAIEQHGHHLPLATDTLCNNLLLGKALELVPADCLFMRCRRFVMARAMSISGFRGRCRFRRARLWR
jgi:hypothetical protein